MQAPVLNSAALSRYEYARRYFIDPLDPFGSQRDFLSYCHLQDASSLDPTESGVRVFERWPHIVEVALALQAPILLAREGKAVPKEDPAARTQYTSRALQTSRTSPSGWGNAK